MDRINTIFRRVLPIYWAFLTYMLLRPGVENVNFPFLFEGLDKIVHLCIFMFLGFSFTAALPRIKFIYFLQVMVIYGLLTEILQEELGWGRSLEGLDLVADVVGALAGYYIYKKMQRTIQ